MASVRKTSTVYVTSRERDGCREYERERHREDDQGDEQNREPEELDAKSSAHNHQEQADDCSRDEEIDQLREDGGERKDDAGQVNLGDEVCICDQTVRAKAKRRDKEGPWRSLH